MCPAPVADEPQMETYELTAPDGTIVQITRIIDTGEQTTTRTSRRAWPLPTELPAS